MIGPISEKLLKKTLKTVASTVLETASMVLDKGAELADDANEWVESLDKKDTTARDDRNKKRKNKNKDN